jgi:tRNA wybutosine-synthesizing protein 2
MGEGLLDFLVPRIHVKAVKTALENQALLDKTAKITAVAKIEDAQHADQRMRIPTKISLSCNSEHNENPEIGDDTIELRKETILKELGLDDLDNDIGIAISHRRLSDGTIRQGPFIKGLERALGELPKELLESLALSTRLLVDSFPTTYSIYKPMLLLPPNAFSSASWTKLLATYPADSEALRIVWNILGQATGTTHVAINAGIPLSTASVSAQRLGPDSNSENENILRSPINLTPIYGDFGPPAMPARQRSPTREDFDSALWVSTTQNGIHQVWAPLYTMFSRGNIREKTRLLKLPSVRSSISETEHGCTAVDLYAGIGYFAFSYRSAGIKKTLCWELNPWSIEGLRRGAERNGWTTQIVSVIPQTNEEWIGFVENQLQDTDFLIFQQSNEEALPAISQLAWNTASLIPPIRHVNCGFLPSSRLSWKTAVRALDSELGGWIHAHENVGSSDIEGRKKEVMEEMQQYLDEWEAEKGCCGGYRRRVNCTHVEKVKTYAPGVEHVVFDVWVEGTRDAEDALSA